MLAPKTMFFGVVVFVFVYTLFETGNNLKFTILQLKKNKRKQNNFNNMHYIQDKKLSAQVNVYLYTQTYLWHS